MANLKFYRQATAPTDVEAGAVLFSTAESIIKVYNGTTWESYGGKILDVTYDEATNKLTLTKLDGTTSEVDLHVYSAGNGISIEEDTISADVDYISDNVILGTDIIVTNATGTLKVGDKVTADTSLKALLKKMLQEVKQPSDPTKPSITVKLTNAGAKEVGTKVTPAYTTTFNAGSYTYGPATGVTAGAYSVSDGTITKTTATGTFDEITVGESTDYKLTATATYSDGVVANDNTGATSNPEVKISAGTTAAATSSAITGFRSWFVGTSTEELGEANYTSDFVRSLNNKNSAPNTNEFTIAIPAGARRVIVAVPDGWKLNYCKDSSALNSDIAAVYKSYSVDVEGANGYTATTYKVYAYEPSIELIAATYSVKLIKG